MASVRCCGHGIGVRWDHVKDPLDRSLMSGYSVRTVPRGRAEATLPPDTRLERQGIAGYSDATWVTRDRRERAHCCGACARKRPVRERGGSGVGRDCFFSLGVRVIENWFTLTGPIPTGPVGPDDFQLTTLLAGVQTTPCLCSSEISASSYP